MIKAIKFINFITEYYYYFAGYYSDNFIDQIESIRFIDSIAKIGSKVKLVSLRFNLRNFAQIMEEGLIILYYYFQLFNYFGFATMVIIKTIEEVDANANAINLLKDAEDAINVNFNDYEYVTNSIII